MIKNSLAKKNPKKAYETVRKEFGEYKEELLNKPEIILITKKDLVSDEKLKKTLNEMRKKNEETYASSIYDDKSIEKVKEGIYKTLG